MVFVLNLRMEVNVHCCIAEARVKSEAPAQNLELFDGFAGGTARLALRTLAIAESIDLLYRLLSQSSLYLRGRHSFLFDCCPVYPHPFQSSPNHPTSIPLQSARGSDTMGREEQVEEREVLDSIFPEEITGQYRKIAQQH